MTRKKKEEFAVKAWSKADEAAAVAATLRADYRERHQADPLFLDHSFMVCTVETEDSMFAGIVIVERDITGHMLAVHDGERIYVGDSLISLLERVQIYDAVPEE